ncbi:MAG TPA: NADH-quinone oxidoreductase subunit J [Bacteroidota bacterium]
MQLFDVVFYVFALITLLSGCIVVFSKNIIYSAFSLLFTFFGVAALYVLLHADFLAVTQILIYVGGILVLLLFGVMLTNNVISVEMKTGTVQAIPALIIAAVVAGTLAGLSYSTWKGVGVPAAGGPQTTTGTLGQMLMTSYVLPFEIASVVLLVALIGAAMTARRHRNS